MSDKRARCGACGELWPCSVKRNQSAYRADIVVTHHAMPGVTERQGAQSMKTYTVEVRDSHGFTVGSLGPFKSRAEAERATAALAARIGEKVGNATVAGALMTEEEEDE